MMHKNLIQGLNVTRKKFMTEIIERRMDDKRLVDLHVNLPTMAVIILQTFAAAWATSALFSENASQTKQLAEMTNRIYLVERAMSGSQVLESRMVTMENEMRLLRLHWDQLKNVKQTR